MNLKAKAELDNERINISRFLSRTNEPIERYSEYLSQNNRPSEQFNNPRNFFEDSNKEDRKLFNIAKNHLGKLK